MHDPFGLQYIDATLGQAAPKCRSRGRCNESELILEPPAITK